MSNLREYSEQGRDEGRKEDLSQYDGPDVCVFSLDCCCIASYQRLFSNSEAENNAPPSPCIAMLSSARRLSLRNRFHCLILIHHCIPIIELGTLCLTCSSASLFKSTRDAHSRIQLPFSIREGISSEILPPSPQSSTLCSCCTPCSGDKITTRDQARS